jgi:hypothetical protein
LPKIGELPHGFIMAASCVFSKKTRDDFRLEVAVHEVA